MITKEEREELVEYLKGVLVKHGGTDNLLKVIYAEDNLILLASQAETKEEFIFYMEGIDALSLYPPGYAFWYLARYGVEHFGSLKEKVVELGFFTEQETRR